MKTIDIGHVRLRISKEKQDMSIASDGFNFMNRIQLRQLIMALRDAYDELDPHATETFAHVKKSLTTRKGTKQ